jgi:cytochrome c oxidase subunit IV
VTTRESVPRRNWGGVVIAIAGAAFVGVTVLNGITRSDSDLTGPFAGPILGVQLGLYLLVPVALIVGFVPLAFGARGLMGIVGPSTRARFWLLGAFVIALIAEYVLLWLTLAEIGLSSVSAIEQADSARLTLVVFVLLVVLVAGIVVARAHALSGVARWSLIVTVLLAAVTIAGEIVPIDSNWTELPYAIGILFLGLSYWRAGLQPSRSVTDEPKSLAE